MVSYADILNNNTSLSSSGSGPTAVFIGATNGIGLGALKSLTKHTTSPTIFIVGRSQSKLSTLISDLQSLNASATFHSVVAEDLTLLSSAQSAALEITKQASRIDLLIMSPGFITFSPQYTEEGLESCQSIRYYARTRMLFTLLPLLRAAPSPRVVSVLAGGKEGALWPDDWHLHSHYSIVNAGGAASSMTTLLYEELSKKPENSKIVWVHVYPGMVGGTGLTIHNTGRLLSLLVRWIVQPLMGYFGYTPEEAGERVVFAATNGRFRKVEGAGEGIEKGSDGSRGSGVYLVNGDSSVVPGNKVLEGLRKEGMGKKVYEHTEQEFERIPKP